MEKRRLIIGTRASKLALWQAHYIAGRLEERYPDSQIEIRHIATTGDKILDVPLAKIGGKGLFTKEIESAMLSGEIDLAVHSLKDMPTELPAGLTLAAVTERLDPGDAFVSNRHQSLEDLPQGSKVGTSSLRRRAQLLACRPDLVISDLRGNVDTRLRKLEDENLDAIVLAVAGLKRLDLGDRIRQVLPRSVCLPAVGQGVLAIETRADDRNTLDMISWLEDAPTRLAITAERSFLRMVEGGCQVPVGVYADWQEDILRLTAVILSLDGQRIVRDWLWAMQPDQAVAEEMGRELADKMLAAGGRTILSELDCREGGKH